jgi:hypothetical protein
VVLAGILAQPAKADVSFDFAYSNLNQHGSWLVSAQYGHVWQPREYNQGWNPYYDGHWVDTDMGWTWVSAYQWGSIPYHYGTWVADPRYGWVWIPGQVWAPSWVVFRTTPEYIGWAPVPPGFSVGVSMEFGAPSSFIYVSSRDFMAPRIRTAIIPAARTSVFINNTTVVNNIVIQNNVVINRGPDVRMIEKATGRNIQRQQIEQVAQVAPFAHVTRAELAIAPERTRQGVRVDQPVPASQPLPVAGQQGHSNKQTQGRAPASAPPVTRDNPSAKHKSYEQAPGSAQNAPQAQSAPDVAAPAPAPPMAKNKPAPAPPVAKNKPNVKPKSNEQPPVEAQKASQAKPPPNSPQAPPPAAASNQARAEQTAKAQSDAKAKAKAKQDQKAKKDTQEAKDKGADKGGTPPAQDGTHQ